MPTHRGEHHPTYAGTKAAPEKAPPPKAAQPAPAAPHPGGHAETIRCAFCRGRKLDPFGLLSAASRCEVCKGTGTVTVPTPHEPCAFCQGSGSFKRFNCLVCKGKGVVAALRGPTKRCPDCGGLAYERGSGLECLRCHGRGRIAA